MTRYFEKNKYFKTFEKLLWGIWFVLLFLGSATFIYCYFLSLFFIAFYILKSLGYFFTKAGILISLNCLVISIIPIFLIDFFNGFGGSICGQMQMTNTVKFILEAHEDSCEIDYIDSGEISCHLQGHDRTNVSHKECDFSRSSVIKKIENNKIVYREFGGSVKSARDMCCNLPIIVSSLDGEDIENNSMILNYKVWKDLPLVFNDIVQKKYSISCREICG